MGKPFVSSQIELARSHHRDSLSIFGQSAFPQDLNSSAGAPPNNKKPLFASAPGSAWDDALRAAEALLQGSGKPPLNESAGTAPNTESKSVMGEAEHVQFSLDDLIVELEAAEEDSKSSPALREGGLDKVQIMDDHQKQRYDYGNGYERLGRRSSDSERPMEISGGVSEEVISERAAQWGYGVVLKKSSRDSTPRTSTGSAVGGSGGTAAIPAVSRDVKDALASFQLAFLVCGATDHDFPILYASAGFTTMTGYSGDETVGRNCRFLQGADTDKAELAKMREALKTGGTYTGTVLNYKKDGTPFWNLLTISPIKDDDGKVIKYIGMQAEQNSKEQQPRNSKGQKSPVVRPIHTPTFVQDVEKSKPAALAVTAHRRHSSSSIPKPPIALMKASHVERQSAGPEIHLGEQQRRMSQRYSLTSNPQRNTRNSSINLEDPRGQDWREASLRLRVDVDGGKKSSFFDGPDPTVRAESAVQKSKSGRLTSRILRLFRKDPKESKRQVQAVSSPKEVYGYSDSEDERDDFDSPGTSGRNSRPSSSVYSMNRNSGSLMRPEAPMDDLCNRLKERQHQSPTSPRFDAVKQQFCIVHT